MFLHLKKVKLNPKIITKLKIETFSGIVFENHQTNQFIFFRRMITKIESNY